MTRRSLFFGILAAVLIVWIQVWFRVSPKLTPFQFGSVTAIFPGVIFTLFVFATGNAIAKRFLPSHALKSGEMAVIYGVATVAAAIGAYDEAQYLLPVYIYPFRGSQTSQTALTMRTLIPAWQTAQDPKIVEAYYNGRANFWQWEIFSAWLVPVLTWTLWLTTLGATMWAWNVLLRRRWVDQDKLSFPCVQLPLEICREAGFGGRVGGKLFWGGFAFAALIESFSFLNALFPNIPAIPLEWTADPVLNALPRPWNALSPMHLSYGAFHLGICYLIPLDILFSSWFFYLLRKGMEVLGYGLNWRDLGWDASGFPYTRSMAAGAWASLFFLLIWAERKRLGETLAAAFSVRGAAMDDTDEAASYRVAGRVLVFGTLALIVYSVVSGMPIQIAIAYNVFFWILNVTMTRVYAQVGPPILEMYYLDPQKALTTLFGTVGQTPSSLTQFSLMYWLNRDHRGQPMGHEMAAFKAAKDNGVSLRGFGGFVIVACAVGAVICLLMHLHYAYNIGEEIFRTGGWRESGAPTAIGRVNDWTSLPKGPQWNEIGFMGVGAMITFGLARLGTILIGFPLHPIGYALAVSFAVEYNWPAFFLVWASKLLILRYGGLKVYIRFLPVAFGMTLGGVVAPILIGLFAWLVGWYDR